MENVDRYVCLNKKKKQLKSSTMFESSFKL